MPDVLDWRRVSDRRAAVRAGVAALRGGRVVAFPTEAGYCLAADGRAPAAVGRLGGAAVIAVAHAAAARDWAPRLGPSALRLARRCWPGPLTLEANGEDGPAARLPKDVRNRLGGDGAIRLRAPAHAAVLATLRRFAGPLLTAPLPAGTDAASAAAADLVFDDGAIPDPLTPTVVRVDGDEWRVVEPGALPEETLRRQAACVIVFVCTGNTCRSPLAEALCQVRLAERLGCSAAELPSRGFHVLSAGLSAAPGGPAAEEAVAVAQAYGADLSGHQSRPLTAALAAQADYLVGMTHGHLQTLAAYFPSPGARPRLLSPEGEDLADPIGATAAVYEECGREIWRGLDRLVAELAPAASKTHPAA
jgi:protein-tyrosine phosphatase